MSNKFTMYPKTYQVIIYNLEGERENDYTQQTFLSKEQLIIQIGIALEESSMCVTTSKVEVYEV